MHEINLTKTSFSFSSYSSSLGVDFPVCLLSILKDRTLVKNTWHQTLINSACSFIVEECHLQSIKHRDTNKEAIIQICLHRLCLSTRKNCHQSQRLAMKGTLLMLCHLPHQRMYYDIKVIIPSEQDPAGTTKFSCTL